MKDNTKELNMRQLFVIILSVITFIAADAQDIIVKKDGTTITAKVTDVGTQEIKYKKWSNQNGPSYSIPVADLLAINYQNGEKDTFGSVTPASPATNDAIGDGREITKAADAKNAEIISQYNNVYEPTENLKVDGKLARYCFVVLNASSNSLFSTADLEMSLVREGEKLILGGETITYYIQLHNKTNKAIYIDKANCFRSTTSGAYHCYYDPSIQTTITTENVKANDNTNVRVKDNVHRNSINTNVDVRKDVNVVTSQSFYVPQRVLVVPPGGMVYLSENKWVDSNGELVKKGYVGVKQVEYAENIDLSATSSVVGIPYNTLERGKYMTFNEGDIPFKLSYSIRYSTSENFATYSTLHSDFFIKELIGCKDLNLTNPDKNIYGLGRFSVIGTHGIR